MTSRRTVLKSIGSLPLLSVTGCMQAFRDSGKLRLTLAGQALMSYPLCEDTYDGLDQIIAELQMGDVVFTDLEVAVRTEQSGTPTRDTIFLHTAPPTVLACLRTMGFNALALSNNHAWDLGTAGIMATRSAVISARFAAAGTGADLNEASAPAFIDVRGQRVAIIAMATGKIRDGAAATASRAGVNELRLADGEPDPVDAQRILRSIEGARRRADIVIAYHHNHDWGDDMRVTRPWAKQWAARCADAGAHIYASHGAPLLHGVARHETSALFFGLGSLVFQSRTPVGHYPSEVWETAIVHCEYDRGSLEALEFVPVVLNERSDDPSRHAPTRGRPRIATDDDALRILRRLQTLSKDVGGHHIVIEDGRGYWRNVVGVS
jgi:poly-gamma-glutamate capsule biosynthesis protein CapA/YwtB (metallophosphatase superfamily)